MLHAQHAREGLGELPFFNDVHAKHGEIRHVPSNSNHMFEGPARRETAGAVFVKQGEAGPSKLHLERVVIRKIVLPEKHHRPHDETPAPRRGQGYSM
jgi:hypothetical protein